MIQTKNVLDILEQIAETCKQLCCEIYRGSDYSNTNFAIYADKFTDIGYEVSRLQENLAKETEQRRG